MPKIEFVPSKEALTIGAEIELQLLDHETLDLRAASPEILKRAGGSSKIHAELFQSMLEINSGICRDVHDLKNDLEESISRVLSITKDLNLRVAAAGTHPFALYNERKLYPADRYADLIDRNQWIARRLMIFGLHIHIGMRDGEHAIKMNNALLHYLPLLLALSSSSPYWHGEDTELASSRITFFEALPTGGHPCFVQSWEEFEGVYAKLRKTEAIRSMKDIWWDIRPSPHYGTLEIRICDGLPTLKEMLGLTALIHSLVHFIDEQIKGGRSFSPPPYWLYRENKWRASRHGIGALFIINDEGETGQSDQILKQLLKALDSQITALNYREFIKVLQESIKNGLSYERQRAIAEHARHSPMVAVAKSLADEFENDSPIWLLKDIASEG